jgi:cysteinyl-tRNA synthetase, unknown class
LKELEAARCVVVVWSASARVSEWVQKEADIGRARKVLVPVTLDGTLPPPGFGSIQAENLYWWNGRRDNAALKRAKIAISCVLDPNDPMSKLPPPDDEPLIRFRHVLATAALACVLSATYHFGHDPFYTELRRQSLAGVKDWGYQLQNVEPKELALLNPHDMLVLDYSRDATQVGALTKDEVRSLATKPDGSRRILLAYLSIGEAEDYRFYWRSGWMQKDGKPATSAPGWLGSSSSNGWSGNFSVKYWEKGWRDLVFASSESYLAKIIEQGFDGVYLDKVDAYLDWAQSGRAAAKVEMIDFVAQLAKTARKGKPSFLVVAQNADELLADPGYLEAIDAVAREDLVFDVRFTAGGAADVKLRPAAEISDTIANLRNALAAGKAVFVAEYDDTLRADYAARGLAGNGFKPLLASRQLANASGYGRLKTFATTAASKPAAPSPSAAVPTTEPIATPRVTVAPARPSAPP